MAEEHNDTDTQILRAIDETTQKITGLIVGLSLDNTPSNIKKANDEAIGILRMIGDWLDRTLGEAREIGCECPACDEARHHINKARGSIKDSINEIKKSDGLNVVESAYCLGSCFAQVILIPTLVMIMSEMAQHAHDMAREVLAGKIVEISIDDPPCSNCGACGKNTINEEPKKPN